jgi:hypothetical protein
MLQLYGPAAAAAAAAGVSAAVPAMPPLPIGQRSSSGSIKEPGASVWLHEAYSASHSSAASSPSPVQGGSSTGLRGGSTLSSGGKQHASMEDIYRLLSFDCNAADGSKAGSPCPTAPMPTRHGSIASMSSFSCTNQPQNQQPLLQPFRSVGATPEAATRHNRSVPMPGSSDTAAAAAAAGSSSSNNGGYCKLDDLVPAGLPQLKISGRHSGCSDSDSGAAAAPFFLEDSPGCSSSGVGSCAGWPHVSGLQAAAAAGSQARGSPRYGVPACGSALPRGPAAAKQQTNNSSSTKRLWERRQALNINSNGSRSAAGSPCGNVPAGQGTLRTHGSALGPQGFAEIAARLNSDAACDSAAGGDGTPYGSNSSICSTTPLSHSYSNPELCATGSAGSAAPPCARSLFGSVPHMDRPLLPAACGRSAATNSGSRSWLARADSGLFGNDACDHLSVASDDEFIREINSENPLSSAWGPARSKMMGFRYCDATSPLNHPGRASPFKSSPFSSPRGPSRWVRGWLVQSHVCELWQMTWVRSSDREHGGDVPCLRCGWRASVCTGTLMRPKHVVACSWAIQLFDF